MDPVPEIKLIRTDTTLDLSQKAEKVWVKQENTIIFIDWKKNFKNGKKKFFFFFFFGSHKIYGKNFTNTHPTSWLV